MSEAFPRLSILCPIFNEEVAIPLFQAKIHPVILDLQKQFDVRLVYLNNSSTDQSLETIKTIRSHFEYVYYLSTSRNVGYQRSLELGLRAVESDLYVIIDVDCEDPPELIRDFAVHNRRGFDIVYGERVDREENAIIKMVRKWFYRILRATADDEIWLDMAEFALISRDVRDAILADQSSFPFLRASIARVGFRHIGLPFKRQRRIAGKSHYNFLGMFIFAVGGILSSSTLLLRLPIYIFPFWFGAISYFTYQFVVSSAPVYLAIAILLSFLFIGATLSVTALYVARGYKNGLMRPSAFLDRKGSQLPPPDPLPDHSVLPEIKRSDRSYQFANRDVEA